MTNCLPCGRTKQQSTVVALCLQCGAMLCEAHLAEERDAPGGMRGFGCSHLEPASR
ncbi:MAG: DUF2180 family protein [Dehalococcoidia bacterium]